MAQLIVRNVDEKVVRALKLRAAQKGRSAEAEHREVLRQALRAPEAESFKEFLRSIPEALKETDLRRSRVPARKVRL
jgi:plasmid stability protein